MGVRADGASSKTRCSQPRPRDGPHEPQTHHRQIPNLPPRADKAYTKPKYPRSGVTETSTHHERREATFTQPGARHPPAATTQPARSQTRRAPAAPRARAGCGTSRQRPSPPAPISGWRSIRWSRRTSATRPPSSSRSRGESVGGGPSVAQARRPPADIGGCFDGHFESVVCPRLLGEVRRGLTQPYFLKRIDPADAGRAVREIARASIQSRDPREPASVVRDPNDDYLVAHSGGALRGGW